MLPHHILIHYWSFFSKKLYVFFFLLLLRGSTLCICTLFMYLGWCEFLLLTKSAQEVRGLRQGTEGWRNRSEFIFDFFSEKRYFWLRFRDSCLVFSTLPPSHALAACLSDNPPHAVCKVPLFKWKCHYLFLCGHFMCIHPTKTLRMWMMTTFRDDGLFPLNVWFVIYSSSLNSLKF